MTIDFQPTKKQHLIFNYFGDDETTEVVYGGSISSGKSYVLCALMTMKCLQHAGIRIGVAREHLTNLKKTTIVSLFEVFGDWGLEADKHYRYNSQSGEITFMNDSKIILCELAFNPSDPNYTRLGGLLLTIGCIDEAGEINEKGKEIFQTRLGRWKNDDMKVKPMLIMTCNPAKNFLYREFYLPAKDGNLPSYRKFIQALPTDNPHIPKDYLSNLERTLTPNEKRRLLRGDWEVFDDVETLFTFNDINYLFQYNSLDDEDRQMRLSCDIAFTSDECVFVVWEGKTVRKIIKKDKLDRTTIVDTIKKICTDHKIRYDHVSYDADGVGLFLREYFPGGKEIHNGGRPIKDQGYKNLKTELYFKLSELVKTGMIKINDEIYKGEIYDQLSVIKHKPKQIMDNKIELISKSDMIKVLGHSPDIADALAYGMIFHLRGNTMSAEDFVFINM